MRLLIYFVAAWFLSAVVAALFLGALLNRVGKGLERDIRRRR